jgi:hypothetical protein
VLSSDKTKKDQTKPVNTRKIHDLVLKLRAGSPDLGLPWYPLSRRYQNLNFDLEDNHATREVRGVAYKD